MLESGIDDQIAGGVAHEILRELAADFIEAGHSVVMDSPCGWPVIEERGRALAARLGVPWRMIEVTCPGDIIDQRLATRTARLSNPTERQDWDARPGTYRPSCERLVLDGTRPIGELVEEAVAYLRAGRPHSGLGTQNSELAS
jgi:predicted kinase